MRFCGDHPYREPEKQGPYRDQLAAVRYGPASSRSAHWIEFGTMDCPTQFALQIATWVTLGLLEQVDDLYCETRQGFWGSSFRTASFLPMTEL
jgi:hypothetical protein